MTNYLPAGTISLVGKKGKRGKSIPTIIPFSSKRESNGYIGYGRYDSPTFPEDSTFTIMFKAPYNFKILVVSGIIYNTSGGDITVELHLRKLNGDLDIHPISGMPEFKYTPSSLKVKKDELVGLYLKTTTETAINAGMYITPDFY